MIEKSKTQNVFAEPEDNSEREYEKAQAIISTISSYKPAAVIGKSAKHQAFKIGSKSKPGEK